MFQFHNGTINTTQVGLTCSRAECFNSTTVQLIQGEIIEKKIQRISFNSTTVQLIQ